MRIPEPHKRIIEANYRRANFRTAWIKGFIDSCFSQLIEELNITDYQARASKTGKMFEYIFWFIMKKQFDIDLTSDYSISKHVWREQARLILV